MVNDRFGIKLLYPSSDINEQYISFPNTVNELQQTPIFATRVTNIDGVIGASTNASNNIGWLEYTPNSGNDVQLYFLPSSLTSSGGSVTLPVNCDMSHEEAASQGYVNDPAEWQNVEMTSQFFIKVVDSPKGYVFFEARTGYHGKEGGCCQGTKYGVRLYWDAAADKGKFAFYKQEFTNSLVDLPKLTQTTVPSFYQQWFGAKFCIYNTGENSERVRLELWLTPVIFFSPQHASSNLWTRVGYVEDSVSKGWTSGGDECNAASDSDPITWAAPFCGFGWQDGKVIQFMYTSAREIDIAGSFGEDPLPPPDPGTIPDPDPDPGTPPPPPIDSEPPKFPTTMTKRMTLRREVVNNRLCSCDGVDPTVPVPPDPPGGGGGGGGGGSGGGGGGGSNTFITLYNVALNTADFARLALVSGSTTNFLRFGQGVTQTNSAWIGKAINRVEITLASQGAPTGGTGGGVNCVIRKGTDDTIAATLTPIAPISEITTAGKLFTFENITNTYKMAFNDKLLFEFNGGNSTNYVKVFRTEQPVTTGTKIVWQTNAQDPGEYSDAPALDICARVYTLTP